MSDFGFDSRPAQVFIARSCRRRVIAGVQPTRIRRHTSEPTRHHNPPTGGALQTAACPKTDARLQAAAQPHTEAQLHTQQRAKGKHGSFSDSQAER